MQDPIPVQVPEPLLAKNVNQAQHTAPAMIYTREQKGHSIILHSLLALPCLFINVIYISASPRHFWHV